MRWIGGFLLLLLAGCGLGAPDFFAFGVNNSFQSSSGTGVSSGGLTAIAIWTSDSPVDEAERVWVTFDRVTMIKGGREVVLNDRRTTVDLLTLQNGVRRLLAKGDLQPGTYQSLRIELATGGALSHWIEIDGASQPLFIPFGVEPVLQFDGEYRLRPGEEMELQLDFNVRLSVYEAGGLWYLDPRGVLHDAASAGAIEGTALPAGAVVSAQVDGEEIASTRSGSDGFFRITPLKAGRYDLVVSKQGHVPESRPQVRVQSKTTTGGQHVLLAAGDPGSVEGTYLAVSSPGLTVRLIWQGKFFGIAGVNPTTGEFAFPQVPPGPFEVELWDTNGPLGQRHPILVDSGFAALLEFR